jgi:hypothetical protein
MSEEKLRQDLEAAFRARANLYRLFHDELTARLGRVEGEALMARVIERHGSEAAAHYRRPGADARAVGEAFLAASPDGGRMYPAAVERQQDGIDIRVERCPLKDAWRDAGLSPERVATLCRIAGAFDKGLFEAAGLRFSNETWSAERGGGCCHIFLRDGAAWVTPRRP